MNSHEHILLNKSEFQQHMEGLLASPRAISQTFGSLVRYAAQLADYENHGNITAYDVAYQLSPGLDGWVVSVPNLAKQLPALRDTDTIAGIGQKSIAALEALVENFNTAPVASTSELTPS